MKVSMHVRYTLAPKEPSVAAGRVYGTFGLTPEQGEREYVAPFAIDVEPGQIVLFQGVSGTGKTSCLRQFAEQTRATWLTEIPVDEGRMVIEQMGSYQQAIEFAGRCGLSEAQLLLRYPTELSDGQRYRFLMAKALALGKVVLACDEFLATLDRTTAKVIAYNLRKLVSTYGLILAAATTHEDLAEDLQPDWLVTFTTDGAVVTRGEPVKKEYRFTPICSLQEALERIGCASLSGIIGVIP